MNYEIWKMKMEPTSCTSANHVYDLPTHLLVLIVGSVRLFVPIVFQRSNCWLMLCHIHHVFLQQSQRNSSTLNDTRLSFVQLQRWQKSFSFTAASLLGCYLCRLHVLGKTNNKRLQFQLIAVGFYSMFTNLFCIVKKVTKNIIVEVLWIMGICNNTLRNMHDCFRHFCCPCHNQA